MAQAAPPIPPSGVPYRALFVWTDPGKQLVSFCQQKHVNLVFFSTHSLAGQFEQRVGQLQAAGIQVWGLNGGTDWGNPANVARTLTERVSPVAAYQASSTAPLNGFLWDVEYWAQPGADFVVEAQGQAQLMAATRTMLGVPVGCCAAFHCLATNGTREDGKILCQEADAVVVMAYRNDTVPTGPNSQIGLFERWHQYASSLGAEAPMLLCGSETKELPATPQATFFGRTETAMEAQHSAVAAQYGYPFVGQSIHAYPYYVLLAP